MNNTVENEQNKFNFDWSLIGDIALGRPNLGPKTTVAVYRLMQYSIRHTLGLKYSDEIAEEILFDAGKTAGYAVFNNLLSEYKDLPLNDFVTNLEKLLIDLSIGILRMEKANLDKYEFTMTVEEDLDCSGLPIIGEEVCTFDEGFISAIFSAYTKKNFIAKEVDCWCTGDRICRFEVKLVE